MTQKIMSQNKNKPKRHVKIVDYKETWATEFKVFASQLKNAIGEDAVAIHHIGSTSVPNLAAKDIIDIQITVQDFELGFTSDLEAMGLVFREDIIWDDVPHGMDLDSSQVEKRYFQNKQPRMNIHVRIENYWNQRYALLFRDYLRTHPLATHAYEEVKRQLACYFPEDIDAYYDIKTPVFNTIMSGAFEWAEFTNWQMPESDV